MSSVLPAGAEVVVIGGGVVGASTAYPLIKAGVQNVLLLERNKLTCSTTWHSAARVRQLRSRENVARLIQDGAELPARLEAKPAGGFPATRFRLSRPDAYRIFSIR